MNSFKKIKLKFFLLFILIFLLVFILLVLTRKIKLVECFSQFGPCPDKIIANLEQFKGQKLISILSAEKILNGLPNKETIKSLKISRRLPNVLVITIALRQPISRIDSKVLDKKATIDDEGVVIGIVNASVLPYLKTTQKYLPGDILDKPTLSAALVLKKISELQNQSLEGEFTLPVVKIKLKESLVLLDVYHLADNWDDSLQKILVQSKIDSKLPKIIDLRYTQPVLTY